MFCGYNGFGGFGGFGIGLGFIFMIIFWALIIWAIIAIVRAVSGAGHRRDHGGRWGGHYMGSGREDDALRTLRDRYARGDISREEYEQRRADLDRWL